MNIKRLLAAFLPLLILVGCSTFGIIETSDPDIKLSQAQQLIQSNRPLPAEKILHQALIIYKKSDNKKGAAEAYRRLGLYYTSGQYHDNAAFYKKIGTYDANSAKGLNYLKKAYAVSQEIENYYAASVSSFLIAQVYRQWNNTENACSYLMQAINFYKKADPIEPYRDITLPGAYERYEEFIREGDLSKFGCN